MSDRAPPTAPAAVPNDETDRGQAARLGVADHRVEDEVPGRNPRFMKTSLSAKHDELEHAVDEHVAARSSASRNHSAMPPMKKLQKFWVKTRVRLVLRQAKAARHHQDARVTVHPATEATKVRTT